MRLAILREEIGQSIVELSLILPVVVFGLIGGADLARAYALQLAVQNGARAGAEAYAIDQAKSQAQAIQRAKDEMSRTPGMDVSPTSTRLKGLTVTIGDEDGGPCEDSPPTVSHPCFVTVRVRYEFKTVIPWPVVPNTAMFDRSTTMRLFY
jgi:hypothetical protein